MTEGEDLKSFKVLSMGKNWLVNKFN